MSAKILYPAGCAQIPSPKAKPKSGEIINDTAYGPVVVQGIYHGEVAIGDPIEVSHGKGITVEVPSASATTFAKPAEVEVVDASGLAVAADAGDFDFGVAAQQKTAGQTSVKVVLG
ncbi:capsid cement protein [Rhodopirellula bahusiensis]|uniref:capsid cement protein n=1 Tax=Rhodopirellula bahusiensis TaxID=2014065 RepID=UPI003265FF83